MFESRKSTINRYGSPQKRNQRLNSGLNNIQIRDKNVRGVEDSGNIIYQTADSRIAYLRLQTARIIQKREQMTYRSKNFKTVGDANEM